MTDSRFWPLLRKAIEARRTTILDEIVRALPESAYLQACGEVAGLDLVLGEAQELARKLNADELEDDT